MSLLKIAELQGQLSRRDARIQELETQLEAVRQSPPPKAGLRAEPLTDDEIDTVGVDFRGNFQVLRDFARAVIAASECKARAGVAAPMQYPLRVLGYVDKHYGTQVHGTPHSGRVPVYTREAAQAGTGAMG